MDNAEIDTAQVLHSYGQALAAKQSLTCDAGQLPFPKDVIKSAISYYLRQEDDDQVVGHLEFAYQLLADFQELSDDERQSVDVMENLQYASNMSAEEIRGVASRVDNGGVYHSLRSRIAGAVYHLLRSRIGEESEQLQQELKWLRTH